MGLESRISCAPEYIAIAFRKTTRRKLPDSIIAATAIHLGAFLVTSDKELLAAAFQGLFAIHPSWDREPNDETKRAIEDARAERNVERATMDDIKKERDEA